MNFLKNIFSQKNEPIKSYDDFWNWFKNYEKDFFEVVKHHKNIEKDFFKKLSPKLSEIKDGFFYLTGMYDDKTVELVLTPDGNINNIVFVEELVNSAPKIEGWRFTALKPALDIKDVNIEMAGYKFSNGNMSFYSNDFLEYPDEIDITIVHNELNEDNKSTITNGVYIFLDNYLGELDFVTTIDKLTVLSKVDAQKELIPIDKLKDYLIWRQKEFIEKYEGLRYDTENDSYSNLEAELENGKPLIATVNSSLLEWDRKASHPWILDIEFKYDGEGTNGMPDDETYKKLDEIEDEIMAELKDFDGYLNIGRETADCVRGLFFACKDFRKPSKVLHKIISHYDSKIEINYNIYKDKYWQSFNRFRNN
jgi:hypothetical protein